MADIAKRDQNNVPTLLGSSSVDQTPVTIYANPTTHRLLVDNSGTGGDVVGPASSTDNAIARFDGSTGKIIQNSTVTLSDTDGTFAQTTTNGSIILTPNGTGEILSGRDGTAANPAYSFSNFTNTGIYVTSAPNINFTVSGSRRFYVAANQLVIDQGNLTNTAGNPAVSTATGSTGLFFPSGTAIAFSLAGTEKARFAVTTGNLLLGGLTADGTGMLQFPTGTTTAGGIGFSTDTNLYRSAAGILTTDGGSITTSTGIRSSNSATGGNASSIYANFGTSGKIFEVGSGGSASTITVAQSKFYIYDSTASQPLAVASSTAGWIFYTAGSTALTINASQLATFAADVTLPSGNLTAVGGTFSGTVSSGTLGGGGGVATVIRSNATAAITLSTTQQATFAGAIIGAVQALSGAGAVNVTQLTTAYTSTGVGDALTLANGTAGQIKTIVHVVDGGSGVLTPTTPLGYSTITFVNAGDSVTLQYFTQGWAVVGSKGAVIA